MTSLVEFLTARLDEDEAAARAAWPGPWRYDPTKMNALDGEESVFAGEPGLAAVCVASTGPTDNPPSMTTAAHIARHDPERVLREVEAKRAIVAVHYPMGYDDPAVMDSCGECGLLGAPGESTWPCPTVRHLAAVYADYPDYDEEWRP